MKEYGLTVVEIDELVGEVDVTSVEGDSVIEAELEIKIGIEDEGVPGTVADEDAS